MSVDLDRLLEATVASQHAPALAAVAMDRTGKVLYRKEVGSLNANDPNSPKYTTKSPAFLMSLSKLITSVAALQLLEQGKFALDDPVEKYMPEIKDIPILEGIDADGKLRYGKPSKKVTMLHLFTHTGGFTYEFLHRPTRQWFADNKIVKVGMPSKWQEYTTPLAFEPGSQWCYGANIDWLGFCVEAISGLRLDDYVQKYIAEPLGMTELVATLRPDQKERFLNAHFKTAPGTLMAMPSFLPPEDVGKIGGGQNFVCSLDDYAKVLLALLNYGTDPVSGSQILGKETVEKYIFEDWIPTVGCSNAGIGEFRSIDATIFLNGDLLPGVSKGWSLGAMINSEDLKHGRKAGSMAWAGAGNSYYWVDPVSGKLGVIFSCMAPFLDPEVLHCFDAFERSIYGQPPASTPGESGSNFATVPWAESNGDSK